MTLIRPKEIYRQQIQQLYQQAVGALIGMPAVALVTVMLIWQEGRTSDLVAWLGMVVGLTLIRLTLVLLYRRDPEVGQHSRVWGLAYLLLEATSGTVWAALAYWLFPTLPTNQFLIMLILATMAVGALPLLSAVLWIYWAFLLPSAALISTALFFHSSWYASYLAYFTLIFAGVLLVSSYHTNRRNRRSIELIMRNNSLIDSLKRANDRLERQFAQTKQAERLAREAEAQYRTLANATNEGVILYRNLQITDANQQLCDMLGYSVEQLKKLSLYDLFEFSDLNHLEQTLLGNEDVRFEVRCLRRDYSSFPVEVGKRTILLDNNKIDVITIYDITEIKKMAEAKEQFISTVSHELRTPLTSIHAALGMIKNKILGDLTPKQMDLVTIANSNSERLKTLVNDLLDMQKMDDGTLSFQTEKVNLTELVIHAIDINQGFATEHQTRFVMSDGYDDVYVYADRNRLMQVLTNLLSNAAKYSPPDSTVDITLHSEDDKITVRVTDHGPGIPEEFQDRIFERFSQADPTNTRAHKGSGLGLYISKTIIEHLDGDIGYRSESGKGACFYFTLPIYHGDQSANPRSVSSS